MLKLGQRNKRFNPKRFIVLTDSHPLMHSCTHTKVNRSQLTASSSGAITVRHLVQGHNDTQPGIEPTTLRLPANLQPPELMPPPLPLVLVKGPLSHIIVKLRALSEGNFNKCISIVASLHSVHSKLLLALSLRVLAVCVY